MKKEKSSGGGIQEKKMDDDRKGYHFIHQKNIQKIYLEKYI